MGAFDMRGGFIERARAVYRGLRVSPRTQDMDLYLQYKRALDPKAFILPTPYAAGPKPKTFNLKSLKSLTLNPQTLNPKPTSYIPNSVVKNSTLNPKP